VAQTPEDIGILMKNCWLVGRVLSLTNIPYVPALRDVLTDGDVVMTSEPKLGTCQSIVYGGVPPYANMDALPAERDKQSPVMFIV
jgi:hypothetical protein